MAVQHTFKWKHGPRTERLTATRAIRMKCYDCQGWEIGVDRLIRECEIRDCALWPFLEGRNPSKKRVMLSPDKREEARRRMEDLRKRGSLFRKDSSNRLAAEAISSGGIPTQGSGGNLSGVN